MSYNDLTIANPVSSYVSSIADTNGVGVVSLAAGESVDLQLQAAKWSTVQLTAIKVNGTIIGSQYSNVGKWTNFKVTPSGDWTSAMYYTFTVGNDGISWAPTAKS